MLIPFLRGLFRRRKAEAEADDELRFHVEQETAANMARGLAADEARRTALRDLGGLTQTRESVRAVRTIWLDALWQDVRHAVRMLRRSPAFATLAILVLALGIGVNTAVFSIVNAVFFRPLPVPAPQELVYVYDLAAPVAIDEFRQRAGPAFAGVTAHSPMARQATFSVDGHTSRIAGELVTANFFDVVGVKPIIGRTFGPAEDDLAATELAVVIGYELWTREFASDPGVVGRQARIDDKIFTVIGVAGPAFRGLSEPWNPTRYWVTFVQFYGGSNPDLTSHVVHSPSRNLIGRLRPGISLARARAMLAHPYLMLPASDVLVPLQPAEKAWPIRLAAYAITIVVVMVLLIATANIAGILLARGFTRTSELAVRQALGAGASRLVLQLLTESVLLSLAGGLAGLLVAWLLVNLYRAYSPAQFLVDAPLDVNVLIFTAAVCLCAGVLIGLAPARQALRVDLVTAFGGGAGAGTTKRARRRFRHGVVIPQVALAVVLLVVAGVHTRALLHFELADLGYRTEDLAVLQIGYRADWATSPIQQSARMLNFLREALARTRAIAGVESVGLATDLPIYPRDGVVPRTYLSRDSGGHRAAVDGPGPAVSEGFFGAMGMPLVAGRDFDGRDNTASPHVAIISQTLARRLWPAGNGLGRQLAMLALPQAGVSQPSDAALDWLQVIGVVADAHPALVDEAERPSIYHPVAQRTDSFPYLTLVAHASRGQARLMPQLIHAVTSADATAEVSSAQTMTQVVGVMLYPRRAAAWIVGVCGVAGLLLAAIGLYGVVSYSVAQRMREVGIRATLGADRGDILALVLREGLSVAAIGGAIGFGMSLLALRLTARLVGPVPAVDVTTFVAVPLVTAAVILVACYLPARRAARVDPMVVLRGL